AVDIDMRILDGITHHRLRGEMDHAVELLSREQGFDTAAIDQLQLYEAKVLVLQQDIEPRNFEARIVIIVQVVEPDDLIAARQQRLRHEKPYESGGAGDQNFHKRLQSP